MAAVALVLDCGRPVNSGPGDLANVQKFLGSDYRVPQVDGRWCPVIASCDCEPWQN